MNYNRTRGGRPMIGLAAKTCVLASNKAIAVRSLISLSLAVSTLLSVSAGAVELGNSNQGFAYARQNCAKCHAVNAGDEKSPLPQAASFQSVADTPGMTARAIDAWINSSHPTMPNFVLPVEETDNLIAYIISLRVEQ